RRDQLVPVVVIGGGEVEDGAGSCRLPAFDRLGEVRAPAAEGLDQRRVLAQGAAELAEVGGIAGIADAEEDLLAARQQLAGSGARRHGEAECSREQRNGACADSLVAPFAPHPGLIRLVELVSLPAGGRRSEVWLTCPPASRRYVWALTLGFRSRFADAA